MHYDLVVSQFSRMLTNFKGILDKGARHAEARKFDFAVLLGSRLAPDQFTFARQVQILCGTAVNAASYLAGKELPAAPAEENTLNGVVESIANAIKHLQSFKPQDFEGSAARKVSQPRWEGQYLTGEEYALMHATPNFYFHLTTAYAILRHNGVDVGKRDYLGVMPLKR